MAARNPRVRSVAGMQDELPRLDKRTALFLDVDGTLLEIAPSPDAVVVPPGLVTLLAGLQAGLGGALALVSGRSLATLDRLFAPLRLAMAGQHGAELRLRGDLPALTLARDARLDGLVAQARAFAAAHAGLLVEDKGLGLTIHYRQAPHHALAVQAFGARLLDAAGARFELLPVHMGVELKPRAISKRSAVEWFMREPPFRGRVPIVLGDDRTDEDGFAAALALGGRAVRVGCEGPSVATVRIAAPHAVRAWLAAEAGRLG